MSRDKREEQDEEDKEPGTMSQINKNTLMPIGLAVAIFGGLYWQSNLLSKEFEDIKTQLLKINNRIDIMEIRYSQENVWTNTDMRDFVAELKSLNPTMKFPEMRRK